MAGAWLPRSTLLAISIGMILTILFWLCVGIVFWLGLRNLISIVTGMAQEGSLKPSQRAVHAISLVVYWGAGIAAILLRSYWPLLVGWGLEVSHRNLNNAIFPSRRRPSSHEIK